MEHFETLVLRAQSGILSLEQRQEAFSELVRRFQALIYHRAQETLNDPHWAQDIAQETFLSAWVNLERLRLYSSRQRLKERLEDLRNNHVENRHQPVHLSATLRPDQVTDCLQSVLETERLRCLVARAIPVPVLVTVQQQAEPLMLQVADISGAIAPTPATIY